MLITQTAQEQIDQIKELSKIMTDKEIGKLLNKSRQVIQSIRVRNNISSFKNFQNQEFENKLKEYCNGTLTDKEIAQKLNTNRRKVEYYRNKLSLKPKCPIIYYTNNLDRIKGYMLRNSKSSAFRRNLKFNLTVDDFELPDYCPILNIKLYYNFENRDFNSFNHASVDRIDNSKGYIKGNIMIISRLANAMKNEANFDQLITFTTNINKIINYYKDQGALGSITDIFPDIKMKT